ncbi:peptidase inhibitor family I36 protein [Actinocorallia libanotica]|uniref:Peptidase inhibitor family I36 n=1 Tax=Actinocorallia libanotica TaxID=46162 RepID=A0ABN1R8P2_9ACTN
MTKKKSAAVTIACAAAVAALHTAPLPAAARAAGPAAPQWQGCPVDEFCVWEGPDGTGKVATYRNGTFNVANQGLVNGGRSAWNRTNGKWCWLDIPGRTFMGKYVGPNQQLSNTAVWAAHRPDYVRCIP